MKRALLTLVLHLGLSACATQTTTPPTETKARVEEAVIAPLTDLNLVRTKIPLVLVEAKKMPYALPANLSCDVLTAEILALNEALGPDFDTPPSPEPEMLELGTKAASDATIDALKGAAVSWIPYRSWVRKLTGAEQHSKEVAAAIKAGLVRRAYLKGIGQSNNCQPPATPNCLPPATPDKP